jgi:hypothetical protein
MSAIRKLAVAATVAACWRRHWPPGIACVKSAKSIGVGSGNLAHPFGKPKRS